MAILRPKIFLDSGDPAETKKAKALIGTVDGQTTNPSLVAKNPEIKQYIAQGKRLSEKELLARYKEIIGEIGRLVAGPISVEVYADWNTPASTMLAQAEEMATWGRNIYIKFPTIPHGLQAAHEYVQKGGKVNMTLVFTQAQAAAVYSAALSGSFPSFVSPFLGRWDDRGYKGLDLVKNIAKMYKIFDKRTKQKKRHVQILASSIRSLDHFYSSIFIGADIMTVPLNVIQAWVEDERWIPDEHYRESQSGLKSILYHDIPFAPDYASYAIPRLEGDLLDEGISKFVKDWKSLLQQ